MKWPTWSLSGDWMILDNSFEFSWEYFSNCKSTWVSTKKRQWMQQYEVLLCIEHQHSSLIWWANVHIWRVKQMQLNTNYLFGRNVSTQWLIKNSFVFLLCWMEPTNLPKGSSKSANLLTCWYWTELLTIRLIKLSANFIGNSYYFLIAHFVGADLI